MSAQAWQARRAKRKDVLVDWRAGRRQLFPSGPIAHGWREMTRRRHVPRYPGILLVHGPYVVGSWSMYPQGSSNAGSESTQADG